MSKNVIFTSNVAAGSQDEHPHRHPCPSVTHWLDSSDDPDRRTAYPEAAAVVAGYWGNYRLFHHAHGVPFLGGTGETG